MSAPDERAEQLARLYERVGEGNPKLLRAIIALAFQEGVCEGGDGMASDLKVAMAEAIEKLAKSLSEVPRV